MTDDELSITDEGAAIVESGLSVRQASEMRMEARRRVNSQKPTSSSVEPPTIKEWGIRYEVEPHDLVMGRKLNDDGTITRTTIVSEDIARQAKDNAAPLSGKNHRIVSRKVTEWVDDE